MSVTISFTAEDHSTLVTKLSNYINCFSPDVAADIPEEKEESAPVKKKRGNPKGRAKSDPPTTAKEAEAVLIPEEKPADAPLTVFTRADAQNALQRVNVVKGIEVARSVLKKLKCEKLSDVDPDQYEDFVGICEAILAK